jgi:hypothetical protein
LPTRHVVGHGDKMQTLDPSPSPILHRTIPCGRQQDRTRTMVTLYTNYDLVSMESFLALRDVRVLRTRARMLTPIVG